MANQSGTLTSSQGSAIIGTSPNDTITFTPSAGTYTVEYPLGTTAISASTGVQSLAVSGGQLRLTCATGSVAWSVADGNDGTPLSQTELSSVRSLVSGAGISPSRIAYIGDSQSGAGAGANTVTAATYDPSTGVLTCTKAAHGLINATVLKLTCRAAPQWNIYDAACTFVSSSVFTLQLPIGLSGQPTASDIRWTKSGTSNKPSYQGDIRSLTGGRVRSVRNAGVTGETWGQIRARIATEIAPVMVGGGVVVIQGGHNDCLTGPVPVATSIADMQGAVSDLRALGLRVILVNCTPLGGGYATTAARVHLLEQNRAMAALAQPGVVAVIDAAGAAQDPTSLFNSAVGYVSADNLHWSGKLSRAIAVLIANVLNSWFPVTQRLPVSHLDCYDASNNPNSSNRMQNGLCLTTTGGVVNNSITGTAAAQFQVATDQGSGASFTASVQAASWGVGNSQKLAWSSLTFANNLARIYCNSQHARFAPGQKVRLAMRVKTTGLGGGSLINYIAAHFYCTVDGVQLTVAAFNESNLVPAYNDQQDWDGLMESDILYIPAGTALTSLYWQVGAYLNGVCAGSIEIGQVDLIRVA